MKDASGKTQLVMQLTHGPEDHLAAREEAAALLARLNGTIQVLYGNHLNVTIGAVGCIDSSGGPLRQFVHLEGSARIAIRFYPPVLATVNADGTPPLPPVRLGDQWMKAAEKDEHLKRALLIFGSIPLDWRGLYVVLDAIAQGNGGEAGLIARKWVQDGQIKLFKHTSDSFERLGKDARHGKIGYDPPKATMTINEARGMIRTLLEKWIKSLV